MIKIKTVIHFPETNSVEATWVDENNTQVRCHSYADVQMDDLVADLGDAVAEYQDLIARVTANIKPVAPKPVVITPVSPRQIRQALTKIGLRQAVEDAVMGGDQDTKDWWEFSSVFDRYNAEVIQMATVLNVSSAQVDELWILASTL